MKRHHRVAVHKRPPAILCRLQQTYAQISEIGLTAFGVLQAALWIAIFPVQILFKVVLRFDALAQTAVRGLISLCFALLAVTMIAAVLFALFRTLFHPWFI